MAGLQPQSPCELVVWQGLRRHSKVDENGLLSEEVGQGIDVPFVVIPFQVTKGKLFGNGSSSLFPKNRGIGTILTDD